MHFSCSRHPQGVTTADGSEYIWHRFYAKMPRHLCRLRTSRSPPAFDALKVDLCLLLLLSWVLSCVNHYNLESLIHMKTQVNVKKKKKKI